MSGDYEVGYGKPPKAHRFKPGNKAAKGRKRKAAESIALGDVLREAFAGKVSFKRGGAVVSMPVAHVLGERFKHAVVSGNMRDIAIIFGLMERYAPDVLASQVEALKVEYHRAEGSQVALPPADLWKAAPK